MLIVGNHYLFSDTILEHQFTKSRAFGVYFAKISGKIEDGFTDILGFKLRYLVFEEGLNILSTL